jgi:cytochrome b6-f complex iron-sulfur subunit
MAAASAQDTPSLTRREFLNYTWLASLGFVFLVGFGGATYLFSLPRLKPGEFGGIFHLGQAGAALPKPNDPPIHNQAGKFWLANVNGLIVALYDVCPHLGCLYEWQPGAARFECACHGSRFRKDGRHIEGPASRGLDRMGVSFIGAGNQVLAATDAQGSPLRIPSDSAEVVVDTGKIIQGE